MYTPLRIVVTSHVNLTTKTERRTPVELFGQDLEEQLLTEMCSGSEAGSHLRLIDLCITQL